ncbi:hypothetical protein [Helicobacter bizzozeronii]|uniref:hypothetical protein n=1 Tax=Helicobacter bizzozeronii TaxID=56877 RepID=UPI000CEF4FEE|nr:hypothetical protein [Helicobacter bizzozeronii]
MRWQTATHVLGSLALSSCFVSPLLGDTRSAEYYSTHHEERKKTLKRCEALILSSAQQGKDLSKEQEDTCKNAEWGRALHHDRLASQKHKQQRKDIATTLAQCYLKMANGLKNGNDYVKSDKTCKAYVRMSVYRIAPPSFLITRDLEPVLFLAPKTDGTPNWDGYPKGDKTKLIKCYRVFAQNLAKNQSYDPLDKLQKKECKEQMDAGLAPNLR